MWSVAWFILISSWVCSHFLFLVFLEGATLIGPSPIFWKYWSLPNRSTSLESWTPVHKIKTNVPSLWPTFLVYIHWSWTLSKPYGIKLSCYWECLGNLRNPLGTWLEHSRKGLPPLPPLKKKNKKLTHWPLDLGTGKIFFEWWKCGSFGASKKSDGQIIKLR